MADPEFETRQYVSRYHAANSTMLFCPLTKLNSSELLTKSWSSEGEWWDLQQGWVCLPSGMNSGWEVGKCKDWRKWCSWDSTCRYKLMAGGWWKSGKGAGGSPWLSHWMQKDAARTLSGLQILCWTLNFYHKFRLFQEVQCQAYCKISHLNINLFHDTLK